MSTEQNITTMDQDFALLKGTELTSLRSVSQKTFDLGKGRRQAISYGEPVHFLSAGKLVDIDNRLTLDEKKNVLHTIANAYSTDLAYKDNGKAIFIVYDNDRTEGITRGLNIDCTKIDPYSNKSAFMGEQRNLLIKNTITSDALPSLTYVKDKYTDALKKLSETEMLTSSEDFNKMYDKAKANYESIITPYMTFANQTGEFKFSLDGDENGGDETNMSYEQYRSKIMNTFNNSIG